MENLDKHYKPKNNSNHIALDFTKFLRFIADNFFKKKYCQRAVGVEKLAAEHRIVAVRVTR